MTDKVMFLIFAVRVGGNVWKERLLLRHSIGAVWLRATLDGCSPPPHIAEQIKGDELV